MFSQMNSCSPRFQEPINSSYIQMSPYDHPRAYQNKYDETHLYETGSNSTCFAQINEEESEVVDELIGILVECLKRSDIKTREALLMKFFFKVENEESLKRFLIQRIKHSKLYLESCLDKIRDIDNSNATRGIINGEETVSEKLKRFKVKTVRVGEILQEEAE